MALEIQNETIVGTVDNLQEKLDGELPINILELLYLINSWGKHEYYTTADICIRGYEAKECYDLSKFQTVFVKTNTCSRAMLTN